MKAISRVKRWWVVVVLQQGAGAGRTPQTIASRGMKKMNKHVTTRLSSRHRSETAHRRPAASFPSLSEPHRRLCASAPGRRVRLVVSHPLASQTVTVAQTARKGMCMRAPMPLRTV